MLLIEKNDLLRIKKELKSAGIVLESSIDKLKSTKTVIIICGPTCTGKTQLAIHLAKLFSTDILSVDSMQVYRGMNIGTDKFRSENYGIKQYMVDISDPDNPVTVVEFRDICRKVIEDEFLKKGKIPLVAGGSGLYIRAVIDDLEFTPEAIIDDRNIREKVKNDIRKYGLKRVFEDLQFIDPVYSKKISSND